MTRLMMTDRALHPLAAPAARDFKAGKMDRREYLATMAASIPLKKLGRVEDIGNAALFLASKEAGYMTGQAINYTGGLVMW